MRRIYCREVMKLKMKEQRLIIKGNCATVLLAASLPYADGCDVLNAFYARIYSATVDAARAYAESCSRRFDGMLSLSVACTESCRNRRIRIERRYVLSYRKEILKEHAFFDVFDSVNMKLLK